MHLDPRRLVEAVGDNVVLDQLADDTGLEPRALDVADCRDLVRRLLLHSLALLDSGTPESVADLCARAQDQVEAGNWITNVLDEFHSRL